MKVFTFFSDLWILFSYWLLRSLAANLYVTSVMPNETFLVVNYQDKLLSNFPFLLVKFDSLKLILQLTFCSIPLAFLNIWLSSYHTSGNDAHTEMKSYGYCVKNEMFNILIVCGRCSFVNLMDLDRLYNRVLLGQSGQYSQSHSGWAGCLGQSASHVDICFLTPKLLNYPGQFLLLQMTHFIPTKTSGHLSEIFFFSNQNSEEKLSFCEILLF